MRERGILSDSVNFRRIASRLLLAWTSAWQVSMRCIHFLPTGGIESPAHQPWHRNTTPLLLILAGPGRASSQRRCTGGGPVRFPHSRCICRYFCANCSRSILSAASSPEETIPCFRPKMCTRTCSLPLSAARKRHHSPLRQSKKFAVRIPEQRTTVQFATKIASPTVAVAGQTESST